jgi:cyclopropane fatty-acyl-phospholipid synthase-like methyltransferase
MTESRLAEHFQHIYQSNEDPWAFGTSPYEQAKYRRTLEALEGRHFTSGLEVGCSIGILTRMLAGHCDRLLGIDIVEQPLQAARVRCADLRHAHFQQMQVPGQWPDGCFDLIVFSEVLYFLNPADIEQCAQRAVASLLPDATVLLANWLGQSDDPCTGEEAADRFIAATRPVLQVDHADRQIGYRLDRLRKMPKSVP